MTQVDEPLSDKWRRFRKRPSNERALILRTMALLPMTEIGLRWFGFRWWKEVIEHFSLSAQVPHTLPLALQREMAGTAVRAVRSVELHGPVTPNCLERSMTLWWLLRSEGIEGELHIGARKEGEVFQAHAWVELGGQVLNDSPEVHNHYARFDAPIAAAVDSLPAVGKVDSNAAGRAPLG